MTGNNVNHANDYLARVYAQTLLKTLEISDYGKPGKEDSSGGDSDSSGARRVRKAPPREALLKAKTRRKAVIRTAAAALWARPRESSGE